MKEIISKITGDILYNSHAGINGNCGAMDMDCGTVLINVVTDQTIVVDQVPVMVKD